MRHLSPFRLALVIGLSSALLVGAPSAQSQAVNGRTKAAGVQTRDLASAPPEAVGIAPERLRRLDAAMKRLVDEQQVVGLVTLLERHGKIVHFNANGRVDARRPDPLQRDSIFRIYSMTKPVTGVAMMMLYEEGKWRLDDPVARYIP